MPRAEAFQYFVNEVEPQVAPYDHALNEKMLAVARPGRPRRAPLRRVSALGAPGFGNLPGRKHPAENRHQHQAAAVRGHRGRHERDPRRPGADPAPGRRPPQKPRPRPCAKPPGAPFRPAACRMPGRSTSSVHRAHRPAPPGGAERGLRQLPRLHVCRPGPVRLHAAGLLRLPRRHPRNGGAAD